jgi:hypothetical protein
LRRGEPDYELSDQESDQESFLPVGTFPMTSVLLLLRRLFIIHPIYSVYYCHIERLFISKLLELTTRLARNFITSTIGFLVIIVLPLVLGILYLVYINSNGMDCMDNTDYIILCDAPRA